MNFYKKITQRCYGNNDVQYGRYFSFKVIQLENDTGDPHILFHKIVSLSMYGCMYVCMYVKLYLRR
jgi:hypothetical protein